MSILDKYRQGVTDSRVQIETQEGQPYKAFEIATSSQRRLDLRPGYDAQRMVLYGYITEVFYAGDFMIDLLFHGYPMHVAIRGKNLGELIAALREERVVSISEYIPEWHTKPTPDMPVVQSLIVTKPGREVPPQPEKH